MLPLFKLDQKCGLRKEYLMNMIKKIIRGIFWFLNYLSWIYRYLKLQFGFNTLKDIKILSVEFSSICNLHCKYCFLDELDRPRFLDIRIYEKLIKEVAENSRYNIKVLEWPISGEFFVYPQWKEVIAITKSYMDKHPRFRPHIILNDNLILMNEERIDLILTSGIVSQIICSVDGHDAKTFEDMRPPAKFTKLLDNMRLLYKKNRELQKPIFLQINNGRDENSIGKEFSEEMKEILRMGHDVTQWEPKFWNESFNKSGKKFYPAKGFCSFVFNNITLTSSGYVSKCCMDLRGQTEYADLRKNMLENIWSSAVRKKFLTLMFRNQRRLIKGCNTCSIMNTNNDNRYNNPSKKIKKKILSMVYGKEYFLYSRK